ncbi:MAG TPA: IreB family regulatory phosphoprotein, partial [Firmicutes bacterium]|nr:IreB family regulatory phosphoprotein [Bacillota bacterium]
KDNRLFPTYITSHGNARSLVRKVERDEILEELIRVYVERYG